MDQALLNSRYQIEGTLRKGPYATTYLAMDGSSGKRVVIKELTLKGIDEHRTVELFEREAKALASLNHSRIPTFIEFFTVEAPDDLRLCLVHEFIDGEDLARVIEQGRHFTPQEVIQIGLDLCEILEYLHGLSPPFIHRDIKPSNILLGPEQKACLIDFGAVRDKTLHDRGITDRKSMVVGTFGYMPFEQFEGRAIPASDIYSLGATLIYLLAHKHPVELHDPALRLDFRSHVHCPEGLALVLDKMVRPNWEDRYQHVQDLKRDLKAVLAGKAPPSESGRPWLRYALLALLLTLPPLAYYTYQVPSPSVQEAQEVAVTPMQKILPVEDASVRTLTGDENQGKIFEIDENQGRIFEIVKRTYRFVSKTFSRNSAGMLESTPSLFTFSPDGKLMATASNRKDATLEHPYYRRGKIHIWDTQSWEILATILLPRTVRYGVTSQITCLAYSGDGQYLAVAQTAVLNWDDPYGKFQILVLDAQTWEMVMSYTGWPNPGYLGRVEGLGFTQDGLYLGTAARLATAFSPSIRQVVEIIDLKTGGNAGWEKKNPGFHHWLTMDRNTHIFEPTHWYRVSGEYPLLSVQERKTGKTVFTVYPSISPIDLKKHLRASIKNSQGRRFTPNSSYQIEVADSDYPDKILKSTQYTPLRSHPSYRGDHNFGFTPDSHYLVAGFGDDSSGSLMVWDISTIPENRP